MIEQPATHHPAPEELEGFLSGSLEPAGMRRVLGHLLPGCSACTAAIAPLVVQLLGRPRPATPAEVARYELPVERAIAAASRHAEELAEAEAQAADDLAAIIRGDRLPATAETSAAARRDAWSELLLLVVNARVFSASTTVDLAEVAAATADRLEPGAEFSAEYVEDLRARARAELGNARRIADDLAGAETELARAKDHLRRGSMDPLLVARWGDLLGSLYSDQRRFADAVLVLDGAVEVYLSHGELHLAGRTLVKKGLTLTYAGEPEAAFDAYLRSFDLLDTERDPDLLLAAVHNVLLFMVDAGHLDSAQRLVWRIRALSKAYGSDLDQVRLLGVEARLEASTGNPARAERLFRKVVAGFEEAGQPYVVALVSLDLAAVVLDRGRPFEVVPLLDEALSIFRELKVGRETLATILLMRRAVLAGEATAEFLRAKTASLRRRLRARGRPAACRLPPGRLIAGHDDSPVLTLDGREPPSVAELVRGSLCQGFGHAFAQG